MLIGSGYEVKTRHEVIIFVFNRINPSDTSDIVRVVTLYVEVLLEGAAGVPVQPGPSTLLEKMSTSFLVKQEQSDYRIMDVRAAS
jgi:hypothetical protein